MMKLLYSDAADPDGIMRERPILPEKNSELLLAKEKDCKDNPMPYRQPVSDSVGFVMPIGCGLGLWDYNDIADYDSLMKFVYFLKDKNVLKSKGHGIDLFTNDRVVSLIDKSSKRVNVLVDRDGKAQYCRLEDFSAALLDMIRREKRNWNLDVYALSVGHHGLNALIFYTSSSIPKFL